VRVQRADDRDTPFWLALASEVEPLFGPMVNDPAFHQRLRRNIELGSAFCIRQQDGPPGAPVLGGLLFSPRRPDRPEDRITWLAVAEPWWRHGVGRRLVEHVIGLVPRTAVLTVVTFGPEIDGGQPARRFYERLGFLPAEMVAPGPDGGSRQCYRLDLAAATEQVS
jgi:GNAT superfamily N-acetyltransferase